MTLAYVLGAAKMVTRQLWAMGGARHPRRHADPVTDSTILYALERQAHGGMTNDEIRMTNQ